MHDGEYIFEEDDIERIAVIGMAGRFPGAENLDEFWNNIRNGVESVIHFTDDELTTCGVPGDWLKESNFVKAGTILKDVDKFDASFFGYSPREATLMDPQHRIFLEAAWEALENAGYTPDGSDGPIGVFAGCGPNDYFSLLPGIFDFSDVAGQMALMIGNEKDNLATRVSYKLNLKGPSMTIQTGCSTSLVAVHLACQSLLSYQCSLTLAGGSSVKLRKSKGYFCQEGTIMSPDGHCRAFDAKACGTVIGQGAGVVVLKRLSEAIEDGDHIYGVIRGCAVNNDGNLKIGYTAPSVVGQAEVIAMAHALSDTPADTISYLEAHGTGTKLGDPIEIEALTQAFRASTLKRQFCAIGSVKTNIGHADISAGIAGLIKTVLMLKNKEIPPSLNFEESNPEIDFENSPFYVSNQLSEWKVNGQPRRAGVSSFGIGGTNVHAILEEAPTATTSGEGRTYQLLLLSARTPQALDTAANNLSEFFKQHSEVSLSDVAFTLQVGRKEFEYRRVVVCRTLEEAASKLDIADGHRVLSAGKLKTKPSVGFMFSGQGSQYAGMGLELYHAEPIFRETVDECFNILASRHSLHLHGIIFPKDVNREETHKKLTQTAIAQPALFVIEYALAKLWMSWGVHPDAMIGHSIGEYVAACLSGVFSLEDALSIVFHRGHLMQALPPGSMLAVPMAEEDIAAFLGKHLFLAAVNSPSMSVVSGGSKAIGDLKKKLKRLGIESQLLHTSHAFHSVAMEPILDPIRAKIREIQSRPPQIPFISNVTGTWISAEDATSPDYWATHLRQPVRFSDGVYELLKAPARVLLEIGPGHSLSTLARKHQDNSRNRTILSSTRHPKEKKSDVAFILESLGKLWLAGIDIDWVTFYRSERRRRIPLPAYPFERVRFWPNTPEGKQMMPISVGVQSLGETQDQTVPASKDTAPRVEASGIAEISNDGHGARGELETAVAEIWERVLGAKHVKSQDNFFDLGGDSLLAVQIFDHIEKNFGVNLPAFTLIDAPTVEQLAAVLKQEGI